LKITQGTFSFLPDFTDEEIEGQLRYAVSHNWALSIEHTDDAHPRNAYWEMWGLPHFDTKVEDIEVIMREVRAAREAFPERYIKVIAYDPSYTRQTTALAFIVNRPPVEQTFHLERTEDRDRVMRYQLKTVRVADGRVGVDLSANGGGGTEAA
jgi:ribulose-bisphosphate carboxylase small chain